MFICLIAASLNSPSDSTDLRIFGQMHHEQAISNRRFLHRSDRIRLPFPMPCIGADDSLSAGPLLALSTLNAISPGFGHARGAAAIPSPRVPQRASPPRAPTGARSACRTCSAEFLEFRSRFPEFETLHEHLFYEEAVLHGIHAGGSLCPPLSVGPMDLDPLLRLAWSCFSDMVFLMPFFMPAPLRYILFFMLLLS